MKELMEKYRPWLPEEKVEALFLFQAGTVWASWESVYESFLADKRFETKLVLITETAVEKSHMRGARQFLEENRLNYELYENIDFECYRPHVVFIQFPYDAAFHAPDVLSIRFKKRGCRVVYIPYGIEISDTEIARKDHFFSFVVENCWRLYTSSYGIQEEYNKYCHNREAVRVTGSPKFDGISRRESLPLKQDILEKSKGRKIMVWKMHFPKKNNEGGCVKQITPYLSEYIEFARHLCAYKDIYFVVLAHPKMFKGTVASDIQGDDKLIQQTRELLNICKNNENVYIDEGVDYRPALYHANAIILDRSAVMIEAAMLDVPVLLMKNSDYPEPMTKPVQEVCDCFCQGNGYQDMIAFVEDFRKGNDSRKEIRKKAIRDNFPFQDGRCGERIKEDIITSINECHRRLRVIFYGTGEICKYYMENQGWAKLSSIELAGVTDSDRTKWGTDFYGFPVIPPKTIKEKKYDAIVIMTEPHYFEIKKSLVYDLFLDERRIWRLDEFIAEFGAEYGEERNVGGNR